MTSSYRAPIGHEVSRGRGRVQIRQLMLIYFVLVFGSLPMAKSEDYGALDFGAPGDEKNDKSLIHLAIGGQRLAIPRNYINLYDKNAEEQQVVALELYWPGLAPILPALAPKFKEADFVDHLVTIDLSTRKTTSWAPVDTYISNLEKLGDSVTLKPAEYGLSEVFWMSMPDRRLSIREFIGQVDHDRIWLSCHDNHYAVNPPQIHLFCHFRFPRHGMIVSVRFGTRFLESWNEIYVQANRTLDGFLER